MLRKTSLHRRRTETRSQVKSLLMHNCDLPEEEPLTSKYVSEGYFVEFRRLLRRLTILSEKHPRTKQVFQSHAAITTEISRHLHSYYNTIHPFSLAKSAWEYFMTVVLYASLLECNLFAYLDKKLLVWTIVNRIAKLLDIFCLMDIVVLFNTGYLNEATDTVVLDKASIAKKYLKTWFICDVLPFMYYVQYIIHGLHISVLDKNNDEVSDYLSCFTIFRIFAFTRYFSKFRDIQKKRVYLFNFIRITVVMFILLVWATAFMYMLATNVKEPWMREKRQMDRIATCIYKVAYMVFLVGHGENNSVSTWILIFDMIFWALGIVLRFVIITEIVQIVSKYNAASNRYYQRVQRLREFMQNKGLRPVTRDRIFQYFDFRYQKTFYREEEVLGTLSEQLRHEIKLQICKRLIENVNIFKDLPLVLIERLSLCMESIVFLPNDIIIQAGQKGSQMFFVHNGTVAVYTSGGTEVCHLSDGSNFGEIALVTESSLRMASVRAVDSCELYALSSEHFHTIISPYQDLHNKIKKLAEDRLVDVAMSEHDQFLSMGRKSILLKRYFIEASWG